MDCQSVTKFGVSAAHRIISNSITTHSLLLECGAARSYTKISPSNSAAEFCSTVSSGEKLVFFATKIPFLLQ